MDINGRYVVGKTAPPEDEQPRVDDVDVEEISVKGYIDATNSVRQINGTFGSGNSNFTANTTQIAARAAWHFLQTWLDNFPQYNPKTGGVNLFAESYGGKYGPTFFEFFELQNERRRSGELSKDTTLEIRLESLGIVNGCIDAIHMTPSYMHYANDNPYGIVAIDNTTRDRGLAMFQERYGCAEMVMFCRIILEKLDSMDMGENEFGNEFCSMANHKCDGIRSLYRKAGR